MLIDANSEGIESGASRLFDVCILGGGVAGITLGVTLAERGLQVAVLEGGDLEYSDESQSLYDGYGIGTKPDAVLEGRLRYLGGTSGHWAGHCVELDAYDFLPKHYVPFSGWPIRAHDLSPYLAKAAEWLEVNALLGAERPFDELDLGAFKPFRKPASESVEPGFEGLPTRFGERYRERLAGNASAVLMLHANALNLRLSESLGTVEAVEVSSLNGKHQGAVRARAYVVCLGGLETPRFLLNCNTQLSAGIGNAHDLVGRFLSWHATVQVGNFILNWPLIEQKYPRLLEWAAAEDNRVAYLVPHLDYMEESQTLNFLMHVSMLKRLDEVETKSWGEFAKLHLCQREFAARLAEAVYGEIWRCDEYRYDGEIHMLIEQAPNPESRVRLADDVDRFGLRKLVADCRLSDQDYHTISSAALKIGQVFAETDIGRVRLESWLAEDEKERFVESTAFGSTSLWHAMGTCRMAENASAGVVDPDLKVFGTTNLYVCGSSVFPTVGHANPTLTIVQLTLRLADHLQARFG